MALIKCPECGKEISDRAESCPSCGCPMDEEEDENDSKDYKSNLPYEFLCLISAIFATVVTFMIINEGAGLWFPLIFYIVSTVFGIKGQGIVSLIGLLLSGFGIFLIVFA